MASMISAPVNISQMLQLPEVGEGREAAQGPYQTPRGTPSQCAPLA